MNSQILCERWLWSKIGNNRIKVSLIFYKFSMKYVAAYLLLSLGGKQNITEADLSSFLKGIDSEVNEDQVKAVVAALKGQSLSELSTKGMAKLSTLSVGTGSGATSSNAAPAPAKAAPAKEEKKEEKVEEPAEDLDLGDMFG